MRADTVLDGVAALVAGLSLTVVAFYAVVHVRSDERERRGSALPRHVMLIGISYLLLLLLTSTDAGRWRGAVRAVAYALGATALLGVAAYEHRRFSAVRRRARR